MISNAAFGETQVPASPPWKLFGATYAEAVHLNRSDTFAGLLVERVGLQNEKAGLETYAVVRIGADSRTYLERSDAVYNDNYLFTGLGVDYTQLLPGLRLSLQGGYSFDLTDKIKRAGIDYRAGFMTYHEIRWTSRFRNEIYSEGFYIRRYRDFFAALQLRSFFAAWQNDADPYKGFEAGPYLNFTGSHDSADFDYNRFVEAHYGARIRYQGPLTLALQAFGVSGHHTDGNSSLPAYTDFRVLLTGYFEFN